MKHKKYRQNPKVKKMFRIKGDYEATKLVQNFVRYITDPFRDNLLTNELIDTENEIYKTDISDGKERIYTIAISTQLDYQDDTKRIKELVKDYVENDLNLIWYTIGDKVDEKEKDFFESLGFIQNEILVGMILDISKWKKRTTEKKNSHIKFRRVNDNKRLADFNSILEDAMGKRTWDYAFYKTLLKLNKNKNIAEIDLLYKDNIPVATGNIFFEKDLAIIDDISTHPNFQHQGLGKMMVNHLITRSSNQGYDLVGLISTPQGYNVYRKLGFKPINLYLNQYITKTKTDNLTQVATKISKGKIKNLQVISKKEINKLFENITCQKCNEQIFDQKYILAIVPMGPQLFNNYHQQCYTFSTSEKWVVIIQNTN